VLEPFEADVASSVERVLFEGFRTYTVNNREVHERCAELVSMAVDKVNSGRSAELLGLENDLSEMESKVSKSVPVLGNEHTSKHLNLIRRARSLMKSLREENEVADESNANG
jgi:DNA topoisomerase VI subunit A